MRLTAIRKGLPMRSLLTSKLVLYMKLTGIFLFLLCLQVSGKGFSQSITLSEKDVPLQTVFRKIEQQSGYYFVYRDEWLKGASTVTIQARDASLQEVLNLCFRNQPLSYSMVDKTIVVRRREEPPAAQVPPPVDVRGRVLDNEGVPMGGVTVIVKGTQRVTVTNDLGEFELRQVDEKAVLVFSSVSHTTREVALNGRNRLEVRLTVAAARMDEVVVTAMGIKREEKSLGYSVSKVEGEDIAKTAPANWLTALSGKIPGLNISRTGSGPGGSVRITLRGQNSLDLDKGEPLLVIDGVPVNSGMIGNEGRAYGSGGTTETPVDYGNAAGEINPEDIENVSVLRGPSATALYGSRAAAGAIIITTKSGSGKKGRGFDIAVSSGVTFDNVLRYPDYQYEYGAGGPGKHLYYSFGSSPDGPSTHSTVTWGPRFEGQEFYQYNPEMQKRDTVKTPWVAYKDHIKSAFRTGVTLNNTVTLSGGNDKNLVRLSLTNINNKYILPNIGNNRNTIAFSSNHNLNRLQINTKINYYSKQSDNLPLSGYSNNAFMYALMWMSPNTPFKWFQPYWVPGKEGEVQNNALFSSVDNPYFVLYEQTNTMDNHRVFGNVAATYEISKKMSVMARAGVDLDKSFRTSQRPYSTERFAQGMYKEQSVSAMERNFDLLYKYDEKLGRNIGLSLSAGANQMRREWQNNIATAEKLNYPGIYNLANSKDRPLINNRRYEKEVNGVFGLAQLSYRNFAFLDLTGRNDWSSTLPKGNNSYFYSSTSGSLVLSELFDLTALRPLSFLKLRASLAQVGNDTDPYKTDLYYSASNFGGSYNNPTTLPNFDLKPEIITNRELGLDVRFFKNRLALDVTYYNSNSRNQILSVPNDPATGYQYRTFNAGLINNTGWEVALTGYPVRKRNGLNWKTNVTWSTNQSTIKELADGVESIILATGPQGYIQAEVGGSIGDIYGTTYLRTPEGQIVHNAEGLPLLDETIRYIGSAVPDWKAGISNQFTYKNVSFSFLFDGQMGGKVYSLTHAVLAYSGKLKKTLPGRYDGIVGEGVKLDAGGKYVPNDIVANAPNYYIEKFKRENVEANTFDVSYIKLREASLSFRLPESWINKVKYLKGAAVSAFGRDLLLITDFPAFDPEIATLNRNRVETGFETAQFPSTRSYGVNLKLNF